MSHFVIEINISDSIHQGVGSIIDTIVKTLDSVGGKLVSTNLNDTLQVLSLIIEAKSDAIVVDLLELQAFKIEDIRHIFLLLTAYDDNENRDVETEGYANFFGLMELRNTLAIEVYPC